MAYYRIEIIPTRQKLAGACAFLMRLASDANLPAMYRIQAIAYSMTLAAPRYRGTQSGIAEYLDEMFRCLVEIVGDPTAPEEVRHQAKRLLQEWRTDE
jgi:uncharacterized protein (UPF0147 family)